MKGVLLLNLGTPAALTENAVRDFLNDFLSDPHVIPLPAILRHFLVTKIILPRRSKKALHAYQQIWTPQGSPLLIHSLALKDALAAQLGDAYCVALGMRYGKPCIEDAVNALREKQCESIVILPLFPQYADATTLSVLNETTRFINDGFIIQSFYQEDFYIHAVARRIQQLRSKSSDFLLMSYHGLPQRMIGKGPVNYQQQCIISSQLIANKLNLSTNEYAVSFQSQLGLMKWIGPYTNQIIHELHAKNIRRLSVVCPSFITDCVETLEEINIRLRTQWMKMGGESFEFIACVSDEAEWVSGLAEILY